VTDANDFRQELAALADGEGWGARDWDRGRGEHPDDDLLLAYGEGRLGADAEERLQEHLTTCAVCRALVGDLCAFPALDEVTGEPSEFEVAAAWRGFRARVAGGDQAAADEAGAGQPAPHDADEPEPFWKRGSVAWTVAATLAFALLGSGAWNLRTESQLAGLLRPSTLGGFSSLIGDDQRAARATRGGEPAADCAAGEVCPLAVTPSPSATEAGSAGLRWVIVDSGGGEVVRNGVSEAALAALAAEGGFLLVVPRGLLAAGVYELHLYAAQDGDGTPPLDTMDLVVE
jgi:hypothetical protein